MGAEHDDRFDELFMRAAGTAGGIEPLLRAFFSFLHRKTDFYVVHEGKAEASYAAGFAPGQAVAMVRAAFSAFELKSLESTGLSQRPPPTAAAPEKKKKSPNEPVDAFANVRYTEQGKQIPVGNGGVAATHTWTQTLGEATAYFDVPAGTTARDIKCAITPTRLDVAVANCEPVKGRLAAKVAEDGSVWTLDRDGAGRASLVVTLEKTQETWWASIFADAPDAEKVDTTLVDSSKKIDEYDDQTQAAIRKIMFDQRQKANGLPTSDEITTNALIDKYKHLPGSPFLPQSDDAVRNPHRDFEIDHQVNPPDTGRGPGGGHPDNDDSVLSSGGGESPPAAAAPPSSSSSFSGVVP